MKSVLIAAFVLIAGLLATACDTLTAARPITKIESRALPGDAVIRRIMGQLGDILSVIPPAYPSDHPVTPLDEMLFWTKARASGMPGLCRADLLSLEFTPTRKGELDANTPTRVSGVWAQSRYRYLPGAVGEPNAEPTPEQMDNLQALCSKFDPYKSRFFAASSEDDAYRAARLYEAVIREADTSPQKFTFECFSTDSGCGKGFEKIPFTVFASVDDCPPTAGPPEVACTRFETFGDETLTVEVRSTGFGENMQIQKVHAEWNIYMSSARID